MSLYTLSSRYFKIYYRNRSFGDYLINFGLFFLPAFHLQYLVLLISLLNRLFLVRKGYWCERARQNHIFLFFLHLLNIKFLFRFMESWHLFDNRYDSGIISSLFSALETFIPLREVLDFAIFTDPVFMNHCDHFFFLHLFYYWINILGLLPLDLNLLLPLQDIILQHRYVSRCLHQ